MNEWEQCISEWADRNMKLQQQLADAQATVEALQQERDEAIEAASLPTWVCNGCGRVSSEGWINRVIDSFEGTDYEMECPTCGVRAIEEDCASDLVRERDDLQAALDAEREKVKGLHEITKVICTHCCEPMEIPSKAVLQTQLTQLQALVRAAEDFIVAMPLRLHNDHSVDWKAGYNHALYDVGQVLAGKRTLGATTPATKGGDGE